MTLHGHEIPEEFVREVEAKILEMPGNFDKLDAWLLLSRDAVPQRLHKIMNNDDVPALQITAKMVSPAFAALRKAGKIEYLGRSQGWRVKR